MKKIYPAVRAILQCYSYMAKAAWNSRCVALWAAQVPADMVQVAS